MDLSTTTITGAAIILAAGTAIGGIIAAVSSFLIKRDDSKQKGTADAIAQYSVLVDRLQKEVDQDRVETKELHVAHIKCREETAVLTNQIECLKDDIQAIQSDNNKAHLEILKAISLKLDEQTGVLHEVKQGLSDNAKVLKGAN